MAIRNDWIVASTTARNALTVSNADAANGDEARDMSTGFIWRLIRGVTGSDSSWTLVSPIAFGTWSGTGTLLTNLDSNPTYSGYYVRFGSAVICWARLTFDATAASALTFTLPLPVASSFTAASDATGVIGGIRVAYGYVNADATNDNLTCGLTPSLDTSTAGLVLVGYKVI